MNRKSFEFSPRTYTLTAIILGYALIGDYTANEQNAIANWFETIGQILELNSAAQQVIEERIEGNTININSKQYKKGGSPYMRNSPLFGDTSPDQEEIKKIKKMLKKLLKKLDNL